MRRPPLGSVLLLCLTCGALASCGARPDGPGEGTERYEIDRLAEWLAGELAGKPGGRKLRAVGVGDFQDERGDTSELGRHLSDELTSALARALRRAGRSAPEVLDRRRLADLLDEKRRESLGLVSPREQRGGEIGGVDALVTGRIESRSDAIRLSIQVLDSGGKGAILAAMDASLLPTAPLRELEGRTLKVRLGERKDVFDLEYPYPGIQIVRLPLRTGPKHFEIELKTCARLEETVYCLFSARALDHDRTVYLYGDSRAVMADGSQVTAASVQIGEFMATGRKGRAGDDLVRGVPTSALVRFDGISSDADQILLLTLRLHGNDAEFAQVPVGRV